MEEKQKNVDSQLGDLSRRYQEQLGQAVQQLEEKFSQKDTAISSEMISKFNELRTEFHGQLATKMAEIQGLNAGLRQSAYQIQILETMHNRAPIGFSARCVGCTLKTGSPALKCFNEIICNEGGHYQPSTGVFTAPIAGMYVVNLSHTQSDEGEIFLNVVQSHRANQLRTVVACTWTYNKHSTSSDSTVVRMQEGDSLYIQLQHYDGSGQIWSPSSFCCFLVR